MSFEKGTCHSGRTRFPHAPVPVLVPGCGATTASSGPSRVRRRTTGPPPPRASTRSRRHVSELVASPCCESGAGPHLHGAQGDPLRDHHGRERQAHGEEEGKRSPTVLQQTFAAVFGVSRPCVDVQIVSRVAVGLGRERTQRWLKMQHIVTPRSMLDAWLWEGREA